MVKLGFYLYFVFSLIFPFMMVEWLRVLLLSMACFLFINRMSHPQPSVCGFYQEMGQTMSHHAICLNDWKLKGPSQNSLRQKKLYNNKTTRVWFLREQKHTSDGLWPWKPQILQVVGFPGQRLSTKTTEKLLLIPELHMPGSQWRYADGATTSRRSVQQYAWRHWGFLTTLTQQRKSVLHVCCIWYFYTTPGYHGAIAWLHGSKFVSFLRNILRWW
jgi:hypothetical protein